MDSRLEAQRLEDRRQEAGEERRPLETARCRARRARRALALGQGPRRTRNERARRSARRRRNCRDPGGAKIKPSPRWCGKRVKNSTKAYRLLSRLSAPETSA